MKKLRNARRVPAFLPGILLCLFVLPLVAVAETRVGLPGNVFARLVNNQPAGIVAEAFDEVMRQSGTQPSYITMSADDGVRALRQGDLSALAVVVPGGRLAEHAWFSAPVVTEYNVILTHRGKGLALQQVSDLYGKRIAGRVGYRYPLLEGDDDVQLSRYQTNGEMIRAMLLDREDMVIISGVSDIFAFRAEGIMSRLEIIDTAIGSVPLVVAFSKKYFTEADVAAFNRRIEALQRDARWEQILGHNGMSDLVREWPVLAR